MAGILAGIYLASSRKDLKIIILESGTKSFDKDIHNLNYIDTSESHKYNHLDNRYRGVGGSSSHWGGRLLPLRPSDIEARPYLDLDAWPINYEELNKYHTTIEKILKVDVQSYEEEIVKSFKGSEHFILNNQDFNLRFPKWLTFKNCNFSNLFSSEIKNLKNLEIFINSTVSDLKINKETALCTSATAISLSQKTITVIAKEFLLTSGTLDSTKLLLQLETQTDFNSPFSSSSVLGHYFNDHLGATVADLEILNLKETTEALSYNFIGNTRRSIHFEQSARAQQKDKVASGFAHIIMHPTDESPLANLKSLLRKLQRGRLAETKNEIKSLSKNPALALTLLNWRFIKKKLYWPSNITLTLDLWIEQIPQYDNRLSLSSNRDALGLPILKMHWAPTSKDEETFKNLSKRIDRYWKESPLHSIALLKWRTGVLEDNTSIISSAADLSHPAGTIRMGNNPSHSIVSPTLQTHSIKNLSVASAAVFPSSGSANPTYTILQLALRAAENILKTLII
jgi:choline dehydrogenase-like flavoprotein